MTQANEIESVKPALSVVLDDGDFIINSTGAIGKAMVQSVLPMLSSAKRVTIITDGEMRVMKRNGSGAESDLMAKGAASAERARKALAFNEDPDIQDQFAADLESGVTGEQATGESPAPTPGPSDPVVIPAKRRDGTGIRRKPQIFQDAAAPPAPELALAEMDKLIAEAEQAEKDKAKEVEDRRFQNQQAIQAGQEPVEPTEARTSPRKREPRNLATTGRPCGRCAGVGQIVGEAGFQGMCPVCHGEGQVKTWDRSLKIR
ncbi:MAG TPA: hypothetical protein VMQ76_00175 [Terracidiphilus sp.]|nr:hypothetical protein [Terracidiphilus sp.]